MAFTLNIRLNAGLVALSLFPLFILATKSFGSNIEKSPFKTKVATESSALLAESPLSLRYSTNTFGDIELIGNAIVTCDTDNTGCQQALVNGQPSNNWTMYHIDIDSDGSTFNSSSAELSLPPGSEVLFAGLYWMATNTGATIDPPNNNLRTSVKFSTPNTNGYADLTGIQLGSTNTNDGSYGAFMDVTSYVQNAGSGTYTVGNIQVTTGDGDTGPWGGWSLAIVYEDPDVTQCRNLSIFDGYENFFFETESVTVSGFQASQTGPINTRLGFFMGDGDIQNDLPNDATDVLSLNGTSLSNALNPSDNFFNNSITDYGSNILSRNPNPIHNLVVDIDMIDAPGILLPGSTSAIIESQADEGLWWSLMTVSIDVVCPDLDIVKSSNASASVNEGDTITYTIEVTNDVNSDIVSTGIQINDLLPAEVTYIPGSAEKSYFSGGNGSFSHVFPTRNFNNNVTQSINTTGLIPSGATLLTYAMHTTGISNDFLSDISVQARYPGGTAYNVDASNEPDLAPDDPGNWDFSRGPSPFSGTAEGVFSLRWVDSYDEAGNDNIISSSTLSISYATPRIQVTDGAGDPPLLVASSDSIDLMPGETMTITLDVVVNSSLDSSISSIINTATVSSNEQPNPSTSTIEDFLNQFPMADDENVVTDEDTPITINVTDGDDFGGDGPSTGTINLPSVGDPGYPSNGTITLDDGGTPDDPTDDQIIYTPDPNYNGNDQFTYEICDSNGDCSTATVDITINPVNDVPNPDDDMATTDEDTPVTIDVTDGDDFGGDGPSIGSIILPMPGDSTYPAHGTITLDNGGTPDDPTDDQIIYTPDPDYNGPDQFSYEICDEDGDCSTAIVDVNIIAEPDPPLAVEDITTTDENTPVTINIIDNDTDPDDNLAPETVNTDCAICTAPDFGEITIHPDGSITYQPDPNFVGIDSFIYEVCDSTGLCTTAPVYITVVDVCLDLSLFVNLEGSLVVPQTGSYLNIMRTTLNNSRLLPGQYSENPFTGNIYTPMLGSSNQAYNIQPWMYVGNEGPYFDSQGQSSNASAGYPSTVVDWVLVSLRSSPQNGNETLCQRAGLLHSDGQIEFLPSSDCCNLNLDQSYYVVIEHRNHLIVMSHEAIAPINGVITYDFRDKQTYINDPFNSGTFVGQKEISSGVFAMIAGNGDQSTVITEDTDITAADFAKWLSNGPETRTFKLVDFNMDGEVSALDYDLWETNAPRFTSVPRD